MQILLDLQKKMELIEACLFFYFNYIFSGNGDSFVPFLTFGVYFLSYPIYILFFIIIIIIIIFINTLTGINKPLRWIEHLSKY